MSRAEKSKQQHKYYAVSNGRTVVIYDTWNATSKSVTGFPKAVFKGYDSMDKAKNAMRVTGITEPTIFKAMDGEIEGEEETFVKQRIEDSQIKLFDAENISFVSHENVYSITHDKIHPTGKGAATLARNLGQHLDNVLWQRQRDKRRRPSQPFRGYQPRRGVEESRYHGTYLTGNNINNRVEESRYHGTYHTDNNINNRNEESRYHGTYHTGNNNNNNRNEESRYHGTYHTDNNINNRVEESRYHETYHTDKNINNRVEESRYNGTYHTNNNNNNRNEESRYHGTYHTDNNINNRVEESRYHGTYHTDNNINNRDDNPNAGFWLDNPRRYQRRGWWNNGYQQRRRRWDNTVRVPMRDNLSPNRDRRPNGFSFPRKHFYDQPFNY
ncbi:hypothetical protein ACOMHN_055952 [Nucella lapillus]